jgi:hypothetical protein
MTFSNWHSSASRRRERCINTRADYHTAHPFEVWMMLRLEKTVEDPAKNSDAFPVALAGSAAFLSTIRSNAAQLFR